METSIIHFINVNKDGEYIDNTLGHWSATYDYYLIKYIENNSFLILIKYLQNTEKN